MPYELGMPWVRKHLAMKRAMLNGLKETPSMNITGLMPHIQEGIRPEYKKVYNTLIMQVIWKTAATEALLGSRIPGRRQLIFYKGERGPMEIRFALKEVKKDE